MALSRRRSHASEPPLRHEPRHMPPSSDPRPPTRYLLGTTPAGTVAASTTETGGSTMTDLDLTDLLPAEQRLLTAALAGESCHLLDRQVRPKHDEIIDWDDPNREIRAEFLSQLMTHQHPYTNLRTISVQGAVITGELRVDGDLVVVLGISLAYCKLDSINLGGVKFTGEVRFEGSTFAGSARFEGSTFGGNARFNSATFTQAARFEMTSFTREARFGGARFVGDAVFGRATFAADAKFGRAVFDGNARFGGATFTESARFGVASFGGFAKFGGVTFGGDAVFGGSTFAGYARFGGATFTANARFSGATFNGNVGFDGVAFTGNAKFGKATFVRHVKFDGATFTGEFSLDLNEVMAGSVSFRRSRFDGTVDGVWSAREVVLDEARFSEPVIVRLLCRSLRMRDVELRSGGALQVRGAIDATAAKFGDRTTLSDPGNAEWANWLRGPHRRKINHKMVAHEERSALAEALFPALDTCTSVRSLRRATVADLELSAVDLTDCFFVGAHGLDKMRIDSACTLPTTPTAPEGWRPPRFTRRDAIAEERLWREQYKTWERASDSANHPAKAGPEGTGSNDTAAVLTPVTPDQNADNDPPNATMIAGIYRSLRKGREDASNAPEAADLYYGEMEMRRLAWTEKHSGGRTPSFAEHCLLTAYWAVSGYGLRAWRAFASIGVVIAIATGIFATVGVEDPPGVTEKVSWVHPISGAVAYAQVPKAPFGWGDAFELAARNSVALLRNPSNTPNLTPIGTFTDIAVRLLVPVLLALALLAIRGRTKR
ncbi:pentapeptide repeat-containing protein [Rhodococcus oxybenzonivorans]|uniref:pentapeptide repeat-containing protein n=1 Tax=Rhodococcus oxybenzonivorans TaxID=1990687 RepID=UPI002953B507|nr:pentapeptide repeat-containing protein [Rhodococcus oxybenzonivorans]MDV7357672.1 pentapeptide repeat-containing protein [Rhodococcus oxybenzonivorans]